MSSSRQRFEDKYKLMQHEMKEQNKQQLCVANLISAIVTLGCAVGTLIVLNSETASCSGSKMRLTMWAMLGMHAINVTEQLCSMTGLDRVFCGCLCIVGFFLYEIAVLIYMQSILYSNPHCKQETPEQYWWLLTNIIVYYVLTIVTLYFYFRSVCGSVSKEEVKEEL